MRGLLLNLYALLVGYRFQECLTDPLDIPSDYSALSVDLIRTKATTSITATGLFLAFSIAVLVAIMSSEAYASAPLPKFVDNTTDASHAW